MRRRSKRTTPHKVESKRIRSNVPGIRTFQKERHNKKERIRRKRIREREKREKKKVAWILFSHSYLTFNAIFLFLSLSFFHLPAKYKVRRRENADRREYQRTAKRKPARRKEAETGHVTASHMNKRSNSVSVGSIGVKCEQETHTHQREKKKRKRKEKTEEKNKNEKECTMTSSQFSPDIQRHPVVFSREDSHESSWRFLTNFLHVIRLFAFRGFSSFLFFETIIFNDEVSSLVMCSSLVGGCRPKCSHSSPLRWNWRVCDVLLPKYEGHNCFLFCGLWFGNRKGVCYYPIYWHECEDWFLRDVQWSEIVSCYLCGWEHC